MNRELDIDLVVPHPLVLELFGIERWEAELKKLGHKQDEKAYCKYCYQTHNCWVLSDEHIDPMAWECLLCTHYTADEFMGKEY